MTSANNERLNWFNEARFGMFLHWGPYSVAARGEWVMNRERIPKDEYQQHYVEQWKADHYDPAAWAALAKEAGVGYIVLTARHHDGFALWDSKESDWNAARLGPGRDLVAPFVEAVRAAGLKVGFYFSVADWTHPDYPGPFFRDWPQTEDWVGEEARLRFIESYRAQLKELMTQYGKIDILWYDGAHPAPMNGAGTNRLVREWQPDILINERNGDGYDFRNSEQTVNAKEGAWEACMTLNGNWGWHAGDPHWKTSRDVIELLVKAAGDAGNLLINIGPRGDGTIPEESVRTLREVGAWLKRNRSFLPHSERHGFAWNNACQITVKENRVYLHFHNQPGERFCWADLKNPVRSARFLATGDPVPFRQTEDRLFLEHLPVPLPDDPVTVVELEVDGKPEPLTRQTSFWIPE